VTLEENLKRLKSLEKKSIRKVCFLPRWDRLSRKTYSDTHQYFMHLYAECYKNLFFASLEALPMTCPASMAF
jgi:hypothetical protein